MYCPDMLQEFYTFVNRPISAQNVVFQHKVAQCCSLHS